MFAERAPEAKAKLRVVPDGIDAAYFSPTTAGPDPDRAGTPQLVFTGWTIGRTSTPSLGPPTPYSRPGASDSPGSAQSLPAVQALAARPGASAIRLRQPAINDRLLAE